MNSERITNRQAFFLLFLFYLGNLITAVGAKGSQSAWLLLLILAALSIPVLYLYEKATMGNPGGAVFIRPFGKTAGGILTVLYGLLAIMMAGDAIRAFADFLVINDLNNAGAFGNSALLSVCALFLLYCSARSLGRSAWILFLPVVMLLGASLLFSIKDFQMQRLMPLFGEGRTVLFNNLTAGFAEGTAPAFFPIAALSGSAPKKWNRALFAAGITATMLLALLSLRDTAVLGASMVSMFRFPSFVAAATHRHSEVLLSAAFVLIQPFRAALCLRYAQECLLYWKPSLQRWYPPVLLSLAAFSSILSWSSQQVRWRTTGSLIVSFFLLAGPLTVVLKDYWDKRRS